MKKTTHHSALQDEPKPVLHRDGQGEGGKMPWRAVLAHVLLVAVLLLLALVQPAGATTIPVISCNSTGYLFNTAYSGNPAGPPKASGTRDTYWQVNASARDAASPYTVDSSQWVDAYVVSQRAGWATSPFNNADWIAHNTDGSSPATYRRYTYWYRYLFDLDSQLDPSAFYMKLSFFADDSLGSVYVNGVAQASPNIPDNIDGNNYSPGQGATLVLDNSWKTGRNEILVRIADRGGWSGFLVQYDSQSSTICSTRATVNAVSNGGTSTFGYTGTNGIASQSVSTTAPGTSAAGPMQTLTAVNDKTTLTQATTPPGFRLSAIACTGQAAGATMAYNTGATTDAAGTPARSAQFSFAGNGRAVSCTFTNQAVGDGGAYWDGNGTANNSNVAGGAGTWNATNTNWTDANGAQNGGWAANGLAVFTGTGGAVNVTAAQTIGGLAFRGSSYSLGGSALTGGLATNTLTADAGVSATVGNELAGGNAFDKTGTGTIRLTGRSSFTGPLTVKAGTLVLANGSQAVTPASGSIAVNSGGTLAFGTSDNWGVHTTTASAAIKVNAGGTLDSGGYYNTLWNLALNGGTVAANGGISASYGAFGLAGTVSATGGASSITASGTNASIALGSSAGASTTFSVVDSTDSLSIAAPLQNFAGTTATAMVKAGAGTLTLSGASTYTGSTTVNAGKLSLGANGALPSASAVTVNGGTLDLGTYSQTLSAGLTVGNAGTLSMAGGTLTLSGGSSSIGSISGSGTLKVGAGATLTLTKALVNGGINIVMEGGKLTLGTFSHSLGVLLLTSADSIIDFTGASLSVATLGPIAAGKTLTASNWTAGTTPFVAAGVNGSPARNQTGLATLSQVKLGSNLASATYWAGTAGTPGALMAAGTLNNWDITPGNNQIDAGAGTWDGTSVNWANSDGTANGTWVGGTGTAVFGGTLAAPTTVTVSGTQSIGGLTFNAAGYTLGGGILNLADTTNTVGSSGAAVTATIGAVIAGGTGNALVFAGPGTTTLTAKNTFTGPTTVNGGTLVLANTANAVTPTGNTIIVNSGGTLAFGATGSWGIDAATTASVVLNGGRMSANGYYTTLKDLVLKDATVDANGGANATYGAFGLPGTVTATGQSVINASGPFATINLGSGLVQTTTFSLPGAADSLVIAAPLRNYQNALSVTLSKTGAGTLTLTGANTFTGPIGLSAGVLRIGGAGTLGAGAVYNGSISNDGTLQYSSSADQILSGNLLGAGALVKDTGSGTLTLSGVGKTYTGTTTVTAGTLAVGVNNALPGATALTIGGGGTVSLGGFSQALSKVVTVDSGGTLGLGTGTLTLSGGLTVNAGGWLDLGSSGKLVLGGGTSNVTAIKGTGTITLNPGATLNLGAAVAAAGVDVVMAGGTLNVGANAHSLGTLTQTASSSIGFSGGGKLTVALLGDLGPGLTLTASNWVAGSTGFYATSVSGSPAPARNTLGLPTLNQVKLGSNAASLTYWSSGTNELLAGPPPGAYTYWDTNPNLASIDGGDGNWDGTSANWTTSSGSPNGSWTGGNVATFGGTAGTVTVTAAQSIGGMTFATGGYTLGGSQALTLAGASNTLTSSNGTATINAVIAGTSTQALVIEGPGIVTLGGANTYAGSTSVNSGTLRVTGSTSTASAVSVASSATLGGIGTVAGPVNIAGTLDPGAASGAAGTLNTGALTLGSTATLTLDLGASGTIGGGVSDLVNVTGDVSLGGKLVINKLTGFSTTGTYTLISYSGTRSGTFASTNLSAIGYQGMIQYDDANKKVLLVAMPRVRITQVSSGGTGTFSFVMSGLDTGSAALSTATAGTAVTSATFNGTAGTAVRITQGIPGGWPSTPTSISCVDANGTSSGNGAGTLGTVVASGIAIDLSTTQMRAGADITCTFTNTRNGIGGVVFNDGGAPSGGTNTGTPNDGLRNGSEAGVGGIAVNLTDCASTTYTSTTTDGNGSYSLSIPTAQIGQPVCVQAVLPASTVATGANAAGTLLPDGSITTVGGVGYTYMRASQQAAFTAPSSGTVTLNFGQVPASTLTPTASRQQGRAGGRVVHPHIFAAGTGGVLKVQLGTPVATPGSVTGWTEMAYLDANCTGKLDLTAQQLAPTPTTLTVVQGQQVCFLVHELAPATAPEGSSNAVPVTATLAFSNAAPGLSASYTATDTTTLSNAALQLTKEVRNVTQGVTTFGTNNKAKSGEVLEYRITYTNNSLSPITRLMISDATPTYTSFVQARTETTPSSLTACTKVTPMNAGTSSAPATPVDCDEVQSAGGTGPVVWSFMGTLNGGGEGSVLYQVKVD
ncbi:autotransporter-associated beta strand repeat-containing protein [uncultured Pseudacidovorax sp.]|uniref:beta strand repeat-containing protein n=1 Tax=uncultured Pseudacidovorax sp. TaxID=679313 RepID=UPI0025D6CF6F|nr:autotransporter-associated beta strand repeat-containing protein [uncultured Pseudacidovorax sp.]